MVYLLEFPLTNKDILLHVLKTHIVTRSSYSYPNSQHRIKTSLLPSLLYRFKYLNFIKRL